MSRELSVPELSLVVLIGASGSGKSTFARKHFQGPLSPWSLPGFNYANAAEV